MAGQSKVVVNDDGARARASSQNHSWNAESDGYAEAEYLRAQKPSAEQILVLAK